MDLPEVEFYTKHLLVSLAAHHDSTHIVLVGGLCTGPTGRTLLHAVMFCIVRHPG